MQRASKGQVILVLGYLEHWGNSGEFDPNTLNHREGCIVSYPKCSSPHFTSNEALVK